MTLQAMEQFSLNQWINIASCFFDMVRSGDVDLVLYIHCFDDHGFAELSFQFISQFVFIHRFIKPDGIAASAGEFNTFVKCICAEESADTENEYHNR